MGKLWVFGDSFAAPQSNYINDSNDIPWFRLLADKLDLETVSNRAKNGVDNLYIAHAIMEANQEFQPDDAIIVVLTDPNRFWVFEEYPELANWYSVNDYWKRCERYVSKNQINAAKEFTKHLYTAKHADTIHELTRVMAMNCHHNSRVLQAFFPIPGVNGSLVEISRMEHIGDTLEEKFNNSAIQEHNGLGDMRSNHLSIPNHHILADKLYSWYTEPDYLLDLTTGFEENFLTFKK